ncbi:MFS transporter [Companilactobacillus sp. RD055328]|nr:multidrug efflux MFS transporter [Companilactobacillus sp. RD055328]GKQ42300.1 MFS transporter [Companilactobacillus sp. RD055328]
MRRISNFFSANKPQWKRNLQVLWFGNFMVGVGFSMITPFMSLYIDELGDFSKAQLNMWSGVVFSSTFLVMAFISPIWGRIADRKGRKLMLLRAALGMSIVLGLCSLVTNVYQLLALRTLQGVFSGFISNANTLIATTTPKEESGRALGTLTTGNVSGALLGPMIGGAVAQLYGYRVPFMITGVVLFIAFLLSLFFVHEDFTPVEKDDQISARELFNGLKNKRIIFGMFITTMIIQASNNSINPILSLYVRQLLHGGDNVAFISGIVAAVPGIATVIAAPRFGALGDKIGTQKILLFGLVLAFLVYLPQGFVTNVYQLMALRFIVGISDAALIPQVQTLIAKNSPHESTGRIFGYNQSFQAIGNVTGPMLGSTVSSAFGYGAVFLSTSILELTNFVIATKTTKKEE